MPTHKIFVVGREPTPTSELESLYRRYMDARSATKTLMAGMRSRFAAQGTIYDNIQENLYTFCALYLAGRHGLKPRQHSL